MSLIDINILVRQCLPPHWRGSYKEHLCQVVCAPLHSFYRRFMTFKRELSEQVGSNGQMSVLEYDLNKLYAKEGYKFIELADGDSGGQVKLIVHKTYETKRAAMVADLAKRLPAGVQIQTQIKL